MANTYDFENKTPLETYEWDDVWYELTDNGTAKRILYIGDSISCVTRRKITEISNQTVLCDGYATSKAVDNKFFKQQITLCLEQQPKTDLIVFNNGLHGFHLSDEDYAYYYEDLIKFISSKTDEPIYLAKSTFVKTDNNDRVIARNKVVEVIAKKLGLPVIDLYSVAIKNSDKLSSDGVHFLDEGYQLLAEEILKSIQ